MTLRPVEDKPPLTREEIIATVRETDVTFARAAAAIRKNDNRVPDGLLEVMEFEHRQLASLAVRMARSL